MSQDLDTYYGLPKEVRFCKRCVMSNQRPSSYPEFKHTKDRITPTLNIGDDGICDACSYAEVKEKIDWEIREKELVKLCLGVKNLQMRLKRKITKHIVFYGTRQFREGLEGIV